MIKWCAHIPLVSATAARCSRILLFATAAAAAAAWLYMAAMCCACVPCVWLLSIASLPLQVGGPPAVAARGGAAGSAGVARAATARAGGGSGSWRAAVAVDRVLHAPLALPCCPRYPAGHHRALPNARVRGACGRGRLRCMVLQWCAARPDEQSRGHREVQVAAQHAKCAAHHPALLSSLPCCAPPALPCSPSRSSAGRPHLQPTLTAAAAALRAAWVTAPLPTNHLLVTRRAVPRCPLILPDAWSTHPPLRPPPPNHHDPTHNSNHHVHPSGIDWRLTCPLPVALFASPLGSNHHKYPSDIDRLVFPPLPACLPAAVIYGCLRCCLPRVSQQQPWEQQGAAAPAAAPAAVV